MILKIVLIYVIFLIITIFVLFGFLIDDIRKGRYKVKESILEKEAEKRFEELYPKKPVDELKDEIEKVADLLVLGERSNRYTERLRIKAKNDERIQEIRNSVIENIEIMKYSGDNLKARIKYRDEESEFTLILSFSTVATGRVFLNDYFVFKNKLEMEEVS